MKQPKARWEYTVGVNPHRVTAFEDVSRDGVVTLRWYTGTERERRRRLASLGFGVRGARGALDRESVSRAMRLTEAHHSALVQGKASRVVIEEVKAPLTLQQGWDLAQDADTGKWNKDTPHRKDIDRAIKFAIRILGASFVWDAVDRATLRKLFRRRLAEVKSAERTGFRSAQLTVDNVLAVGAWLRDEQKIEPTAALRWKSMDTEFLAEVGSYEPKRPRYTVEEYRKLFTAAWDADERYGFLYDLGAEGRLGQVARCMRSQLDLTIGQLKVIGRGKKKGVVIVFIPEQLANATRVLTVGYLARLEAAFQAGEIADYPLFPRGHLVRDKQSKHKMARVEYATEPPIDRNAWQEWHYRAEEIAEIPHIWGRGPYGSRRAGVDAAKELKISREGLQSWGGWADSQIPDRIYADQEQTYARDEAAQIRARARGDLTKTKRDDSPHGSQEPSQIVAPDADPQSASTSLEGQPSA